MIFPEDRTDVSSSGPNQVSTLRIRGSSPSASCLLEFHASVCVHVSLTDWHLCIHNCLSNIMFSAHHAESDGNTDLSLDSSRT